MKKFAVVLAGGSGERFWPISQPDCPKQFLSIFNNRPLINQTMDRINGYFRKDERVLVIPGELKRITCQYVGNEHVIIEPMRRNTAPAICLAAMVLARKYGDGILHVMPADHLIGPNQKFIEALKYGQRLAHQGFLVTYGIRPDRPETGYGYVKIAKGMFVDHNLKAYQGAGFTEKPSLTVAKKYLKTKEYLWNSGIFSFGIESILAEIQNLLPEVFYGVKNFLKKKEKGYFQKIPDISIDYGVMEKSKKLCVIKGDFVWDDVGSWLALERYFKKDRKGNIFVGDIKGLEIVDSVLYTNGLALKAYGLKDVIIVASPRGVLVCKKDRAPDLKRLLK